LAVKNERNLPAGNTPITFGELASSVRKSGGLRPPPYGGHERRSPERRVVQ